MRRNEVKPGQLRSAVVNGKRQNVDVMCLLAVAGAPGYNPKQDTWVVLADDGTWHHVTPRQLRRTDVQRCQDTLLAAVYR